MDNCLASTGAPFDLSTVLVLMLAAVAVALLGVALLRRSAQGGAAALGIVILLAAFGGVIGGPAAPANAADECSDPDPIPTIAGVWQADVDPDNPAFPPYTLVVTIVDDGVTASGTVAYAADGWDCEAIWEQQTRTETEVVFIETIVSVDTICADGGTITLTPDSFPPTQLDWWYEYPDDIAGPDHGATLLPVP